MKQEERKKLYEMVRATDGKKLVLIIDIRFKGKRQIDKSRKVRMPKQRKDAWNNRL